MRLLADTSFSQLNAYFPNPFNSITTISFDLAVDSIVSIDIFNIRGQRVKTVTNEHFGAGSHNVEWNGTDENGRSVGNGIYFYRMVSGDFTDVKRIRYVIPRSRNLRFPTPKFYLT